MANGDIMVDFGPEMSADGTIEYGEDGSATLHGEGDGQDVAVPTDHYANLAEYLQAKDSNALAMVGQKLVEAFDRDAEARKEWEGRLARGMEIVGYVPVPDSAIPFKGANTVVYPIISEAVIQFNARVMDELYPAAGPVKTIVVGDASPEKEEQAERVGDFMNYQITEADPSWEDEDDRLMMRLPLDGMGWKKVYQDDRLGVRCSRYVAGKDVYAPYSATTTMTTPRLCHRFERYANDVKFEMLSGYWLECELQPPPAQDSTDRGEVQQSIDEAEGSTPTDEMDEAPYTILEFYVDYNLPGFEHVKQEEGGEEVETGLALPYVITVEKDSQKVLRIVRNWEEDDQNYRKTVNLIPFRFLPGLGFYGMGFLHVIGSLNEAATGALRALLDSAAWANMQGGFVSKDAAGIKSEVLTIEMGTWKRVDATFEELVKGFFTPPRQPPSEALFKLLGMLIEAGKSFTSTTDAMTGAGTTTGPVGTTLALIEQGSKVFSGIHKRMHRSKRAEYRLLAKLNERYLPQEGGYPYELGLGNDSRMIAATDFDARVDVLPVSDPNIFSGHQRIAIAQALLELSQASPQLYDERTVHERMLRALKVEDPDEVLKPAIAPEPHDPVTENMLMVSGKPAHAFPEQNHEAHIAVHQAFMQHPGFGGNPDVQKIMGPIMMAHMAEHTAFLYQLRLMQVSQGQIPFVPTAVGGGMADQEEPPELSPEQMNQIAIMAAMATDPFMQTSGLPPQEDPNAGKAQAEMAKAEAQIALAQQKAQIDAQKAELDLTLKQAQFALEQAQAAAEEARSDRTFVAEERRRQASWAAEERRTNEEHAAEMERAEEKGDQDIELAEEKTDAAIKAQKAKAAAAPKPAVRKEPSK